MAEDNKTATPDLGSIVKGMLPDSAMQAIKAFEERIKALEAKIAAVIDHAAKHLAE